MKTVKIIPVLLIALMVIWKNPAFADLVTGIGFESHGPSFAEVRVKAVGGAVLINDKSEEPLYQAYADTGLFDNGFNSGQSKARADLATGSLQIFTASYTNSSLLNQAEATITDSVQFNFDGTIRFDFSYDATNTKTPWVSLGVSFGGINDSYSGVTESWDTSLEIYVTEGLWYNVSASMNGSADNGEILDAWSTGLINLELPEGEGNDFTSASGFFLEGTHSNVPIPAPIVLLGTGLVGLAGARLRRKK